LRQLDALQAWIARRLPEEVAKPPLKNHVETLVQIRTQDLEPDPQRGGWRIRNGVAEDRRVSIADSDMRHGRKSKSKRFNGFKRHLAADVDRGLILACAITPANRPEDEAMPSLTIDMERQGVAIDQLLIDRGYITVGSSTTCSAGAARLCANREVAQRQPVSKSAFRLNLRDRTIECPQGHVQRFAFGSVVEFDPDMCDRCPCARSAPPPSSAMDARSPLRRTSAFRRGCARRYRRPLDARPCERHGHRTQLAHISQRQGNAARYVGVRKNTFDLRRASAIQNLETLHLWKSSRKGCVMTSLINRSAF